jgi:hypothetical protein
MTSVWLIIWRIANNVGGASGRDLLASDATSRASAAVDLYWSPLGAGGHFVRLDGRGPLGIGGGAEWGAVPDVVTRQPSRVRLICDNNLDRPELKTLQADPADG